MYTENNNTTGQSEKSIYIFFCKMLILHLVFFKLGLHQGFTFRRRGDRVRGHCLESPGLLFSKRKEKGISLI